MSKLGSLGSGVTENNGPLCCITFQKIKETRPIMDVDLAGVFDDEDFQEEDVKILLQLQASGGKAGGRAKRGS